MKGGWNASVRIGKKIQLETKRMEMKKARKLDQREKE